MHIEVEPLPNCSATLRVELPPERVAAERAKIVGQYANQVRIHGYRPGKAPKGMVEARYKKDILEELKRQLVGEGTREAIKEKNLRVLSVADVPEVELAENGSLRFAARLVTAPEFEVPSYQGLPVRVPPAEVPDVEVDRALEGLRSRLSDFNDMTEDRGLAMDDFAVLDFTGRLDGQPVNEVLPKVPREVAGREGFWIKMAPTALLPGFCDALVGAKAGETRDFPVELPADFALEDLAGKKIDYTVNVKEIKTQVLPELNDEFAGKVLPGKTLPDLTAQVRLEMSGERNLRIEETKRRQIIEQLLGAVQFDLPESYVMNETRRIMNQIVRENQERGVTDEEIKEHSKDISTNADQAARDRLRGTFILTRIAEKENIKVTREEFDNRINALAQRYEMTRDKLVENLRANDGLGQVEEELLVGKTLAFLSSNANVETAPDAPLATPEEDHDDELEEVAESAPAGGS